MTERRLEPHPQFALPDDGPWWWACSQPERPNDPWTLWAVRERDEGDDCPACKVALHAVVMRAPGTFIGHCDPATGQQVATSTAGQWADRVGVASAEG